MSGKNIIFDNEKINQNNLYRNKKPFIIVEIDVDKILVSKRESYGTRNPLKYLIGYNDNDVIRPLCIKLPQMMTMLNTLIIIKQCLLRLITINC